MDWLNVPCAFIYLVVGHENCRLPISKVVEEAAKGGVQCVQLREKNISDAEFIALAKELQTILKPRKIPLIINDNLVVAKTVDADGIHIGQGDLPVADVRAELGPDKIIGLSVETMEQVQRAEILPVDYLGVSPIFLTRTKTDLKTAWGLGGLEHVKQASRHPLVAIGGIKPENARMVVEAGAKGLAVVTAITQSEDPANAVRKFLQEMEGAGSE